MRGQLCIRLFFAFVPRSASEGKRRDFISGCRTKIFQAMPHCAFKLCARQSKCLCIASEISAKLFDFLRAKFLARITSSAALKNVPDVPRDASKFWA
jgi:hypothetical protein